MYTVIKDKGKMVNAYQLGSDNAVIKELMDNGKICDLGNGSYTIHSQEAVNGAVGGEKAIVDDWIKDSTGSPYPNDKEYFESNHIHMEGDTFEQIPKPLAAWDAMIVFYSISYDDEGNVIDCEWNFVEKSEFDRTYSVIERKE